MAGKRIIIIGGVAGGASAAAWARRLSEEAEIIVVERGPYVSFASCVSRSRGKRWALRSEIGTIASICSGVLIGIAPFAAHRYAPTAIASTSMYGS